MLPRRLFLASTALAAVAGRARAQNVIPDRQIRLLVGFGAGNGTDTVAHELAPRIERRTRLNPSSRVAPRETLLCRGWRRRRR